MRFENRINGVGGTAVTAEELNKGNWRDDTTLSFTTRDGNTSIVAEHGATKIYTDYDGKTFLVPPAESNKEKFELGNGAAVDMVDYIVESRYGQSGPGYSAGMVTVYKSGKVEQSGRSNAGSDGIVQIVFPIEMMSNGYTISVCSGTAYIGDPSSKGRWASFSNVQTTGMTIKRCDENGNGAGGSVSWYVVGNKK